MARLSAICGNTATVNSGLFLAYSNFMEYKGFAGRLKALQIECDAPKTQYKFAEWLGLSKSFVSELLRGEKLPSMDLAIILSDKFDVNIDWLMRGKGLKRTNDKKQPSPLLDKFNQLCPEQQQIIELMVDQLSNKPKSSENKENKPLTVRPENVGGGGEPG
jgi:transcriptional regulator with XRE-family HTH domain